MDLTLKIIVGLFVLFFLVTGASLMFASMPSTDAFAITAIGADGLSTVRGDIGGIFLTSAALLVLGLVQRRSEWFLAAAMLLALIATGRLVGFVLDGSPGAVPLLYFVSELIIAVVLVIASRRLGRASSVSGSTV